MKKPFLIILVILYSLSSFAQVPLDSFYKKGSSWVNLFKLTISYPLSQPPYVGYSHYIYGFKLEMGEDTVVNSMNYRKMYCRRLGTYKTSGTPPYHPIEAATKIIDSPKYIGRLRVQNRKVYFADEGESQNPVSFGVDRIMYDFSGNTGDSVECYFSPYKMKTTKVDSIQLNTGNYVKRYYYNGNPYYNSLEGIGSNSGTLADLRTAVGMPPSVTTITTVCYSSGNISYHFPVDPGLFDWYLIERCFDLDALGVEKTEADNKLSLYPNPANGIVTIKGKMPSGDDVSIEVMNMQGQVIYHDVGTQVSKEFNKQIDLSREAKGIYLVRVSNEADTRILRLVLE